MRKKQDIEEKSVKKSKGAQDTLYIKQDSLIQMHCKRGKSVSVENYRVLAFFDKHYNKWYVTDDDMFLWDASARVKKVRVLARLLKKTGSRYEQVKLVADGDWAPKQVFCVRGFKDVLKVESELVDA